MVAELNPILCEMIVLFFSDKFPVHIGPHGSVECPSSSPDVTPYDFFIWGTARSLDMYCKQSNKSVRYIIT